MTILELLGTHVARAYRASLPDSLRQAARLHLADTVGAWIAATGTPEGRALMRFASTHGSGAEANPFGEGMPGEVAANCALARLSEIDDIHLASGITPGALIVPAALTIGAALGSGGAAVAEAIAVGYDAMVRLGGALDGAKILYRGIWPTYFAAPFGVAATAARLLALSEAQSAHALGIALGLASPSVGRQTGATMARWLAIGNAARNGVFAALAARAGFAGDLRIFEGEFFSGIYSMTPDVAALIDALGDRPALPETSFKPWCAARQTMAAGQALRELRESGVSPEDMSEIVVSVPHHYLKMIDHGIVGGDRASHLTSVAYQLALAALAPDAMLDVRQAPDSVPEEIRAFMSKVRVKADDALLQHYPDSWPARLEVTTRTGAHAKLVLHIPGDPQRPFDESVVAAKYRRVTAPLIGDRATHDLLRMSLEVFDEDSVPALIAGIGRVVLVAAETNR
jgi:2-methylcitrate dehydratase PrpD